MAVTPFILLGFAASCVTGHVAYIGLPNRLQQVAEGVYINPSADGSTADLYVAATEDSGIKTSWLTDHPVNYLNPAHQALPVTYTSSLTSTSLPHEETVTSQKRAVISSPPIKYAYAYPVSSDGSASIPYPYEVQSTPAQAPQTEAPECSDTPASAYTYPMHLYYSQMMAAFANALNSMKESGNTEEKTNATPVAPAWPSYAYPGYPVQYVMVDPSAWTKAQSVTPATPTSTPSPNTSASNENV